MTFNRNSTVAEVATALDRSPVIPDNWRELIDADRLTLGHADSCIFGQLANSPQVRDNANRPFYSFSVLLAEVLDSPATMDVPVCTFDDYGADNYREQWLDELKRGPRVISIAPDPEGLARWIRHVCTTDPATAWRLAEACESPTFSAEILARGLMQGQADVFKAGYSLESAALAAIDHYGLTDPQGAELRAVLAEV